MASPFPTGWQCLPPEQQVAGEMNSDAEGQNNAKLLGRSPHRVRPQIHPTVRSIRRVRIGLEDCFCRWHLLDLLS